MMNKTSSHAFTIVELLVVIVVIGILAAITIISYSGIRNSAIEASIKSDLSAASKQLEIYKIENDLYPESVTDCPTSSGNSICLGLSGGNTVTSYVYDNSSNPPTYTLTIVNESISMAYKSTQDGGISETITGWKSIYAGFEYVCGIGSNDVSYCWGHNNNGQLGNNSTVDSSTPVTINTSDTLINKTIKSISTNSSHTCVIASDNQVYCWGYNGFGKLGNGSTVASLIPVAVDTSGVLSGLTIKAITPLGSSHVCLIASDNQAYCWGYNGHGQLGNDSVDLWIIVPVAVDTSGVLSGLTVESISTGFSHTCVIASDNQAYCWGENGSRQLGNGSTIDSSVPVAVDTSGVLSGLTIKSITIGNTHTCVIASDNQAYCWGYNGYGQLGDDSVGSWSSVPVAVDTSGVLSGLDIEFISAAGHNTCAVASDNQAYCWGRNNYGQLGNDSNIDSPDPVLVTNP